MKVPRAMAPASLWVALGCAAGRAASSPAAEVSAASDTGALPFGAAQLPIRASADTVAAAALLRAAATPSPVGAQLEYLTDVIGPRLTGTAASRRAAAWAAAQFRAYGMDSTWREPWRFGPVWERGPMTLTLVAPHHRELYGASLPWAPGTAGPVTGDVMFVDATSLGDFERRFAGRLAGKWVLLRPPPLLRSPDAPPLSPGDSIAFDSASRALEAGAAGAGALAARVAVTARLAGERVAGLITGAGREYGLLTMRGGATAPYGCPAVVVPHETYAQLFRLLARGERVTLRGDVRNVESADSSTEYNVLAEVRGTSRPDEIVVVGAHLDSWDLGTGATDDAAGAAAVMEAARILKRSGLRPARTVRFALFGGEEQGRLGSTAYAERHATDLDRHQAVLVLDTGTGRISSVWLQGRNDLGALWQSVVAPLASLGPVDVVPRSYRGSDHATFRALGVPSFTFEQVKRGYDRTWHSQIDTFEYLVVDDVRQAAAVMALSAYGLANLPVLLPRNR